MKTPDEVIRDTLRAERPKLNNRTPAKALAAIREGSALHALIYKMIEADRAQREPVLVLIDRDGSVLTDDAEVIDLAFLSEDPLYYGYEQGDIDDMLAKLKRDGWESAAADVREWWEGR